LSALGAADGDGFADDLASDFGEGFVVEDALGLEQKRGEDSDGVVAEFAPGDGEDVGDGDCVGRGVGEEVDEGLAEGVRWGFQVHRAALDDVAGRPALGGAIDDDGDDGIEWQVGGETLAVFDAVLEDGNGGAGCAEAWEPEGCGRCVVGFGDYEDPIDGGCGGGVRDDLGVDVDGADGGFYQQLRERAAGTENEFVVA
jgi:hypothetical protein